MLRWNPNRPAHRGGAPGAGGAHDCVEEVAALEHADQAPEQALDGGVRACVSAWVRECECRGGAGGARGVRGGAVSMVGDGVYSSGRTWMPTTLRTLMASLRGRTEVMPTVSREVTVFHRPP